MKNDCYKCQFRKDVPGSAHIECAHPLIDGTLRIAIVLKAMADELPEITTRSGKKILEVNEYGFKNRWATWPINFDPTWVTCSLPLPENEEE